jgi:hypothetical protein
LGKTTLLGAAKPAISGFLLGKDFETGGLIVRGGLNLKLGL